jgi:hypothetical protein
MSPANFAKAFTRSFAGTIRGAAGRDGRLSANEATKLPAGTRDNAENFLEATGQKSVSVEKLIKSGYNYAFALGSKVAGPDGRISFKDAEKLPADLKNDYLRIRASGAKVSGV